MNRINPNVIACEFNRGDLAYAANSPFGTGVGNRSRIAPQAARRRGALGRMLVIANFLPSPRVPSRLTPVCSLEND